MHLLLQWGKKCKSEMFCRTGPWFYVTLKLTLKFIYLGVVYSIVCGKTSSNIVKVYVDFSFVLHFFRYIIQRTEQDDHKIGE
jgi:hypothetical protein